mgnify:CR=1 FL=1
MRTIKYNSSFRILFVGDCDCVYTAIAVRDFNRLQIFAVSYGAKWLFVVSRQEIDCANVVAIF